MLYSRLLTKAETMSYKCDICGKGPYFGHSISHAHNVTNRKFMPNLHRVRARVGSQTQTIRVCSRCLKSGKVTKA